MKVNIGGQKNRGRSWVGWTIVDTSSGAEVQMNLMNGPLPFTDNSVEIIYSSHTFEHIYPDCMNDIFSECYRVLVPGGPIRIVVPDIDLAIKSYVSKDQQLLKDHDSPGKCVGLPNLPICYLSSWFFTYEFDKNTKERRSGGHVMAFNFDLMNWYLSHAGFVDINRREYGKCLPEFEKCDYSRYAKCSLYVEARKPK